jgi:uncharacterized DUF497 family protein
MHFEWDAGKSRANRVKRRVTFEEAMSCFYDPMQIAFDDPDHSDSEGRELLVGRSIRQRLLIVCYTIRGQRVRIISAHRTTRAEAGAYAQRI